MTTITKNRTKADLDLTDVVVDLTKTKYVTREEIALACMCAVSNKFRLSIGQKGKCEDYLKFVETTLASSRRLRENIYINAYVRAVKSRLSNDPRHNVKHKELVQYLNSLKSKARK